MRTTETMAELGRGGERPDPMLEAVARALGARRALLLAPGSTLPVRGRLRRRPGHVLAADVPHARPAMRLVVELPRPASHTDELVLRGLAKLFAPAPPPPSPNVPGLEIADALRAFTLPAERRPEALLRTLVRVARAPAGAVARPAVDGEAWTIGPGRAALRRAAAAAVEGPDGTVEVGDRRFEVRRVMWDGEVVAGLALEGSAADLRPWTAALGAAIGAAPPAPSAASSEDDLISAVTILPLPLVVVDEDDRLETATPDAQSLFALSDFDLGRPVSERLSRVVDTDDAEGIVVGDRWFDPVELALPSGRRMILLVDQTKEDEVRREQEELVAALAHELRTPVAGVKALLEVLKLPASTSDPERFRTFISEGVREITRLERLVEDLLLASRVATGGIHPRPDAIRVRPVVEEVVRTLSHRYPDRRFDIRGEAGATADPALVRHAVWHLLDNAAKFGPSGETIAIELSEDAEGAHVSVADQGPGIFSGDVPDLFQPFKRLERRATSTHGGAGIGLYLVKAVIDAQGGDVTVRSRLGKGSTFGFRLPAAPKL